MSTTTTMTTLVRSQHTGVEYIMRCTERKDCCSACAGRGYFTYATYGDRRSYVARFEEWDGDGDGPEMMETGRRDCERCSGTGTYPGDGPSFAFKLTLP